MSRYRCEDCGYTFDAPTDTATCRCGCGERAWREEPTEDVTEQDVDRMLTEGVPVQIVTGPPSTFAAAPSAPADRDLRDRIRRAICEASGFEWDPDSWEPDEYGEHADAVLAVLPAPADRAAVLREAADAVARFTGNDLDANAKMLRRMADEAQQAGEFFEEDEPVGPLVTAFRAGPVSRTGPPTRGRTEYRDFTGDEAGQPEVFGPDVVAYGDPHNPRVLLCRTHGGGKPGLIPLDSADLPDGGICTHGQGGPDECGVDVLAQQPNN